mmetsp:Transcript_81811/g.226680  ORF Transcript_81811/g.226680 Transcript_81811/m.226680 type:complete len:263 (+) Transcript_81811:285-1073(+)
MQYDLVVPHKQGVCFPWHHVLKARLRDERLQSIAQGARARLVQDRAVTQQDALPLTVDHQRGGQEGPELLVPAQDRLELWAVVIGGGRVIRILSLNDFTLGILGKCAIQPRQQLRGHVASGPVDRSEACRVANEGRLHAEERRVAMQTRGSVAIEVPHWRDEQGLAFSVAEDARRHVAGCSRVEVRGLVVAIDGPPLGHELAEALRVHVLDASEAEQPEPCTLQAHSKRVGVGHGEQVGRSAVRSLEEAKLQVCGHDLAVEV